MSELEKDKNAAVGDSGDAFRQDRQNGDAKPVACACPRSKLHSFNWLADVPGDFNQADDIVEVSFKNTRRGFYRNSQHLQLAIGDLVAVEASPGHDIGRVSMVGRLVKLQMRRTNLRQDAEILRIFRKAKPNDIARYEEAKAKEVDTMIRSRKIAEDLKLNMKIGDVEYQGDGNKAIFYYIADERVDFRQLIKVLADVFKVRIEMKQIGARQEAGRIGGIGPCGRPLCCSSWMTNFVSVATSAARYQDISLNPQKLAGQCAKLKCCMNFEVDCYAEVAKKLPPKDVRLETKDNIYYHFKTDILKREMTYSTDKSVPANLVTLSAERVAEVIALNKNGVKPEKLSLDSKEREFERKAFGDIIEQADVTRFDKAKRKKNKNNKKPKQGGKQGDAREQGGRPPKVRNNAQPAAETGKQQLPPQQPGKPQEARPAQQQGNGNGNGRRWNGGGGDDNMQGGERRPQGNRRNRPPRRNNGSEAGARPEAKGKGENTGGNRNE